MKKTLSFAIAGSILVQSLLAAPPAHALVAAGLGIAGVAAGGVVALVGSGIFVAGGGLFIYNATGADVDSSDSLESILGSAALCGVGIVVLDQERGGTFAYSAITPEQAATLGITDAHALEVYNSEVPQINAIRETVAKQLDAQKSQGQSVAVQDSAALWAQYGTTLSPESFEVMNTIVSQKPTSTK